MGVAKGFDQDRARVGAPPLGLPPPTLSAGMGAGVVSQLSAANYASRRVAGAPARNGGLCPFFKVMVFARRSLQHSVGQGAGRPRRWGEFGEAVVLGDAGQVVIGQPGVLTSHILAVSSHEAGDDAPRT